VPSALRCSCLGSGMPCRGWRQHVTGSSNYLCRHHNSSAMPSHCVLSKVHPNHQNLLPALTSGLANPAQAILQLCKPQLQSIRTILQQTSSSTFRQSPVAQLPAPDLIDRVLAASVSCSGNNCSPNRLPAGAALHTQQLRTRALWQHAHTSVRLLRWLC
jgi:hypothetical protein